ncbi:MAG TPA: tetratricopeptide repeat-containing sensor histidine kinase [Panacibacter sp.]|nr:tetratricopeptide repeat-containing sensor histidine kinase [Panacibacter sp.]HNP42750.1 tetratricopeptide repeat-containing sensor histidine kinase [Panacibacter sp.]
MSKKSSILLIFSLLLFSSIASATPEQQNTIDSLLSLLKKSTQNDSTRVERLRLVSSIYQATNLKTAEFYARQAVAMADSINASQPLCRALSQLGSVYAWERRTTESLNTYFKELEKAQSISWAYGIQDAYMGIGYVYELESDWGKALDYTLKGLPYIEKTTESFDLAFAYNHAGSQYLGLGNSSMALEFLQKAAGIFEHLGFDDQLGDCNINLAKAYSAKKLYDSAEYHFHNAVNIFTRLEEPYQIADTYQNEGDMFVQRGLFNKARDSYQKTIVNYNKDDVAEADYALAVLGLGVVALSERKYQEASRIFHQEFAKINAANIMEPQLKYLNYMAKVDSALGNFKEAFLHMQAYSRLYDNYYDQAKDKATQRMMVEMELQSKEKENEQLKKQYDLQQRQITIFAVAGMALFIAGVLLALLYNQKNSALNAIKEMQKETEAKNNELAVINAVKDKLISMIAHDVRSPLTSLQNILYATREKIINESEFTKLSQVLDNDIRHLISMLDNTLLWAREQIHALKVNKVNFNLHTLAEDVTSLYHQSLLDKEIEIQNNIPTDAEVYSDKEIIHTVLRNMVSNAIKFTQRGKCIVLSSKKQNGELLVSVKDEGAGISPVILEKIRKKEFVSTRGTNKEKGTGLGLLFSEDLLSKLNEKLLIDTVPGEGTVITFSIQLSESLAS